MNIVWIVVIVYLIAFELAVVACYRRRPRCHLHLVVHLNCEHEFALCSECLSQSKPVSQTRDRDRDAHRDRDRDEHRDIHVARLVIRMNIRMKQNSQHCIKLELYSQSCARPCSSGTGR